MSIGTVKWFNDQKGFGFIQPADGGKDVFLHISAVERAGLRTVADGQAVTFDIESGRDGRQSARNLERADVVLQAMVETGAITQAEADAARRQSVTLKTPPEAPPGR